MRATRTKTKTTLACCTGLSLAALSSNSSNGGSVWAFAPSLSTSAASTIGIRKRRNQSAGTSLRMTELLLSDSMDALTALPSAASAASSSVSARGLLSSFLGDSSFVGLPAFLSGQSHQPQSLYLDYLPTDLLSSASRSLTGTLTEDPQVESEVLTDVAHIALDLVTFASPTRALLRLSLCVGRMLAIAADWVPDHYLHPEELVFQCFMLSVSIGLLAKTALPILPAIMHQSTNRYGEKRAYGALFKRHGGLSWVQTKMILAGGGAEWFELAEGEGVVMQMEEAANKIGDDNAMVITEGSDGFLYWLQKGEAELLICSGDTCLAKERAIATVAASSSGDTSATTNTIDEVAILGELEFARKMQEQQSKAKAAKNKKTKEVAVASAPISTAEMAATANKNVNGDHKESSPNTFTTTKIRAGPSGATLLRLDAARLLKLMDDDEALADGIRSIVFAGMQDKLQRVMQEDNTGSTTSNDKVTSKSKQSAPKVNDGMQPLYAAYEPYEHDF